MTSDTTTQVSYRFDEFAIPERLRPFAEPTLIAGESRNEYELLRQLLIEDIQPRTNLEWLWLFDLAELSWEILRYRKLKVHAIEMHRAKAVETLLLQIDGAGLSENDPLLRRYTKINAAEYRSEPAIMHEVEARLSKQGFDQNIVTATTLLQAQAAVALFETLVHRAQDRRTLLARLCTSLAMSIK